MNVALRGYRHVRLRFNGLATHRPRIPKMGWSREASYERRQHLDYRPVVLVRSSHGGWPSSVMGEATGHDDRCRGRALHYADRRFAAAAGAAGKTDTAGETDNKSPDTRISPHQADV